MKQLLTFLACLVGLTCSAQYRPNYFDTNSNPFNVVPGVSIYVPTLYSTNILTTNLSVTDFLFIGTAQVNYLTMLGSINQQGVSYTNYFMADTNYFAGSIFAPKTFSDTNTAPFFRNTNDTFMVDNNGGLTAANFQLLSGGEYVTANGSVLMEQPNVWLTGFQTNTCAEAIVLTAYPDVYAAQSQIDAFPEGPHTPGFMSFQSCAGGGSLIYKTNSHWVMVGRVAGGSGCSGGNCTLATNDNPNVTTGWYEVAGGDPLTFNNSAAYVFAAGELGSIGNITALGTNSASVLSGAFNLQTNGDGAITPTCFLYITNSDGAIYKLSAQKL